jgi:hypothetical protein
VKAIQPVASRGRQRGPERILISIIQSRPAILRKGPTYFFKVLPNAGGTSCARVMRRARSARIRDARLCSTDARLTVIQELRHSTSPLSRADIASTLAPLGYDRATVYRNLVGLSEAGLLSRVDLGDHIWRFQWPDGWAFASPAGQFRPNHFGTARHDRKCVRVVFGLVWGGLLLEIAGPRSNRPLFRLAPGVPGRRLVRATGELPSRAKCQELTGELAHRPGLPARLRRLGVVSGGATRTAGRGTYALKGW